MPESMPPTVITMFVHGHMFDHCVPSTQYFCNSHIIDQHVSFYFVIAVIHLFIISFYCASAVDNRTRLEFHGERRVWDGQFMKKTLQGNSALYIFTEVCGKMIRSSLV